VTVVTAGFRARSSATVTFGERCGRELRAEKMAALVREFYNMSARNITY
jgi:hypothetical protein